MHFGLKALKSVLSGARIGRNRTVRVHVHTNPANYTPYDPSPFHFYGFLLYGVFTIGQHTGIG